MVKIMDMIIGVCILAISVIYYFFSSSAVRADFLSSSGFLSVGIVFVLAGIVMMLPETNSKKDLYEQSLHKRNILLVFSRVLLALYLVLMGIGPLIGVYPLPKLPFFLISSGIPMIIFTLAGIFQLLDSFRRY